MECVLLLLGVLQCMQDQSLHPLSGESFALRVGTGITLMDGQSSLAPVLVPQFEGLSSAASQFVYINRKI